MASRAPRAIPVLLKRTNVVLRNTPAHRRDEVCSVLYGVLRACAAARKAALTPGLVEAVRNCESAEAMAREVTKYADNHALPSVCDHPSMKERGVPGSFYELLCAVPSTVAHIQLPAERVFVQYRLYEMDKPEAPAEAVAALRREFAKLPADAQRSFGFCARRERYCRRRLVIDRSLHKMLATLEGTRKVAWILFFDSLLLKFPRRPKIDPVPAFQVHFSTFLRDQMYTERTSFMERARRALLDPEFVKSALKHEPARLAQVRKLMQRRNAVDTGYEAVAPEQYRTSAKSLDAVVATVHAKALANGRARNHYAAVVAASLAHRSKEVQQRIAQNEAKLAAIAK